MGKRRLALFGRFWLELIVFCRFLTGDFARFSSRPCPPLFLVIFPRRWHGNCSAFNAENAERAEKGGDRGKATANGAAFTAAQRAPFLTWGGRGGLP